MRGWDTKVSGVYPDLLGGVQRDLYACEIEGVTAPEVFVAFVPFCSIPWPLPRSNNEARQFLHQENKGNEDFCLTPLRDSDTLRANKFSSQLGFAIFHYHRNNFAKISWEFIQ
jgi:hypothetical protein